MSNKKIVMEVFRAGKQTDAAGNSKEWTEKDLDKMVSSFEELGEDVPATIGHNTKNGPAMGWFKKVFRKGDTLFAELGDIVDEFGVMLKKKMFKNRSIALRNDFSLRHIAFLGAEPPAVKGLKDFAFKENDEFKEYEFGMEEEERITIKNLRDNILKFFPNFNENKPGILPDNGGESDMEFKEQFEAEEAKNKDLNIKLEASVKEASEFKEANIKVEKEFSEFKETREKEISDAKEKEFGEFAEGLIKGGKAIPAHKGTIITMLKTLDGQEAMDFAEGDKTIKKTPLDIYKEGLSAINVDIFGGQFSEPSEKSGAEAELKEKIAVLEKGGLNFSEASRKAHSENPELLKAITVSKEL